MTMEMLNTKAHEMKLEKKLQEKAIKKMNEAVEKSEDRIIYLLAYKE